MKNNSQFFKGIVTGLIISAGLLVLIFLYTRLEGKLGGSFTKSASDKSTEVLSDLEGKLGGSFTKSASDKSTEVLSDAVKQKISLIEETIAENYLSDADNEMLREGIYKGLVSALDDPYSVYYSPADYAAIINKMEGIYYGIGAVVTIDESIGYPKIIETFTNSPARAAGVLPEDIIVSVDGVDVGGMDVTSVVSLIKGEEGTKVTILFSRRVEPYELELTLTREKLNKDTVTYEMLDDGMGYIRIIEFDDVTLSQFKNALNQCVKDNMKGLILDLRGNPGGNLDTVCAIADLFTQKGDLIVYTMDKQGNKKEYFSEKAPSVNVPTVVLVNGYSASASEVLSGALRDYDIAKLVGTTTYGKGVVQRIFPLSDSSAVKLTISSYFTPSGFNLHGVGLEPDVVVEMDTEAYLNDKTDNQLEKAKEVLAESLK